MRRNKKTNIQRYYDRYINYGQSDSQFNIYLLISIVVLGLFGLMALFSSSAYLTIRYNQGTYYYVLRQLIFLTSGFLIMFIISKINYKFYRDHYKILFLLAVVLLILVYVPGISVANKGARRAIKLGITFMPSDIAKPVLIMALSAYLVKNRKKMGNFIEGIIRPAIIILIPFLLVLFQTDLSTSLVMLLSSGLLFLVGGFRKKYLWVLIVVAIVGILFFAFGLEGYQRDRITAFLNPEKYYNSLSWQVLNGLFAVSRGGITGQGFGRSIYKYGYLSNEVNNDMIFAVIAEEFGFIGSMLVIVLVFTLTYQMIKIAINSRDEYAKLLALGIALIYFIQSMINIGVSISIIPNTGITLPFISNGGTSIWAFSAMFGIVLNISRFNEIQKVVRYRKNIKKIGKNRQKIF